MNPFAYAGDSVLLRNTQTEIKVCKELSGEKVGLCINDKKTVYIFFMKTFKFEF